MSRPHKISFEERRKIVEKQALEMKQEIEMQKEFRRQEEEKKKKDLEEKQKKLEEEILEKYIPLVPITTFIGDYFEIEDDEDKEDAVFLALRDVFKPFDSSKQTFESVARLSSIIHNIDVNEIKSWNIIPDVQELIPDFRDLECRVVIKLNLPENSESVRFNPFIPYPEFGGYTFMYWVDMWLKGDGDSFNYVGTKTESGDQQIIVFENKFLNQLLPIEPDALANFFNRRTKSTSFFGMPWTSIIEMNPSWKPLLFHLDDKKKDVFKPFCKFENKKFHDAVNLVDFVKKYLLLNILITIYI